MPRELVLTDCGPVYRQIAEYFREQIISGDMDSGTRLPTERTLASQLGVNRSTVSAAYDELRAMGLIRSVPGRGTRVSEDSWGQAYRTPDWMTYLEQGIFQPTLPLMRRIWMANRQPGYINFARGEMASELWPSNEMHAVLKTISTGLPLGYSDPRGEEVLRSAIANHLRDEYHLKVSDHRVLVTAGSQQGLLLVIQTLLRPGDAVGLEQPSYAYSLPLFAAAGIRRFPIPVDDDGMIPEAIIPLHRRHKIRMVFVTPTYQNPTGTTLTVSRRRRLLEICGDLRIPIIEDDAHGALTLAGGPVPPSPVAAFSDTSHQVLYLGTLSKTWAPGLRVGWLVGPKSVVDRLAGVREQMDFGVSTLAQVAAAEILKSGAWNRQLAKLQLTLTRRRDVMAQALSEAFENNLQFILPKGGYHLWITLPPGELDTRILDMALDKRVVVVPGSVYGSPPGFLRVTYASSLESEIIEGVSRLHAAGVIDPAYQPKILAFALLGLLNSVAQWYQDDGPLPASDITALYLRLAMQGSQKHQD